MSKPIDYDIFIEDRLLEFQRLKDVYAGEEADSAITAATTCDTTHLNYLNNTLVPELYNTIYGNAYDHMRATHRAFEVINFERSDFYAHAQADMDKQTALYKERKKVLSQVTDEIQANSDVDITTKLNSVAASANMSKTTLTLNIKNTLGLADDIDLTPEMVLEYYKRNRGEKE